MKKRILRGAMDNHKGTSMGARKGVVFFMIVLVGLSPVLFFSSMQNKNSPSGSSAGGSLQIIVGGLFAFQDSAGVIHLFWASNQTGNYDIYEKTYDGMKWSEARQLTTNASADIQPTAYEDHEGAIHLFFASYRTGKFMIYEKVFSDGGWSQPTLIPHKLPDYWNMSWSSGFVSPSVLQDRNGTVYLFFTCQPPVTENVNDLYVIIRNSGWGDQLQVGGFCGFEIFALQDSDGNIHVYYAEGGMVAYVPSIGELVYNGSSWTPGGVANSIPYGDVNVRYPSAFLDSVGGIHLFYSGRVWNKTDHRWEPERIYKQMRTPSGDWSEPMEIAEGIMPSVFQSREGTIYLFYVKDGTIYLMT